MKLKNTVLLLAASAVSTSFLSAQALFDGTSTYSENFNSLTFANNTSTSWTNNSTITGWYLNSDGQGDATDYRGRYPGGASLLDNTFGLYNNPDDLGNYSLGARTAAAMGVSASVGLQLRNTSGGVLTSFDLAYQASQYYQSATQFMRVEYSLNATGVADDSASWVVLSDLTFNALYTGANSLISNQQELDARTNLSTSGVTVVWEDNTDLWVRFISYRDAPDDSYTGSSAVLTVNDVSFTAIPEPGALAMIGGFLALVVVMVRRRR